MSQVPITSDLDGYRRFWAEWLGVLMVCAGIWGVAVLFLLVGILIAVVHGRSQ